MNRLTRLLRAVAAAAPLAAVAAFPVPSLAFWQGTGEASALASIATLPASAPTAAGSPAAIAVSWTAITAPGAGTVKYYLTRSGGSAPKSTCPTSAATARSEAELVAANGALRCTDEGLGAGETRHYTVTAIWHTWTATSGEASASATGAVAKFVVAAEAAEVGAGAVDNLTVTAEDSAGRTVTTYAGTHAVTWEATPAESPSGEKSYVTSAAGTHVGSKGEVSLTFTAGKASVSGSNNGAMKLFDAATTTVKVKNAEGEGSTSVKVNPGAFASFAVAPVTAEPTAGTGFEVKVTAWDQWHNVITSYGRTAGKKLLYSGATNAPAGTAPMYGSGEPTFVSGSATVKTFTFYKAASTTLKVEEETSGRSGEAAFTVKPPTAGSLTPATGHFAWENVKVSAGSLTSPCLFTCEDTALGLFGTFTARVAVTDQWGNVVTALGAGHEAVVEATGGSVTGTSLAIAAAGPAESTTETSFKAYYSEGAETLTVKRKAGTEYKSAEAKLKY